MYLTICSRRETMLLHGGRWVASPFFRKLHTYDTSFPQSRSLELRPKALKMIGKRNLLDIIVLSSRPNFPPHELGSFSWCHHDIRTPRYLTTMVEEVEMGSWGSIRGHGEEEGRNKKKDLENKVIEDSKWAILLPNLERLGSLWMRLIGFLLRGGFVSLTRPEELELKSYEKCSGEYISA